MIELSTEGCRISNLGSAELSSGDQIIVEGDELKLTGRIGWTRQCIAGVRLDKPLLAKELSAQLVHQCGEEVSVRYGT